jgi:hypothetical protein
MIGPPILKIPAWYPSMSLAFPFASRLTLELFGVLKRCFYEANIVE